MRLKNECSQLSDIKIEQISHNNSSHTDVLMTLFSIYDTKHLSIVTIIVLFGIGPSEVKKKLGERFT